MFQNNYYKNKEIVVIPKNNLKNNFNVEVKPNIKKTYDNIRSIVEKDGKQIDNQQMDWIFKSYLNGTFGNPSSLENYGRYIDTYSSYKILDSNKDVEHPIKEENTFNKTNGLLQRRLF